MQEAPAGGRTPRRRGPQKRRSTVDDKSLAHPAHPSTEDHDTVEPRYASLERPHACCEGWVTIGQLVVDPKTGEETEEFALYLCRRCAERS